MSVAHTRQRVTELLKYFSEEYVKAYKTALVLSVRDDAQGDIPVGIMRPNFEILLDRARLPAPNPRLEGEVFIGNGMKQQQKWVMGKNYVVACQDVKGSASAAAAEPMSPMSPTSPQPGAEGTIVAGSDEGDSRVWLDDDSTDVCMNSSCGDKFGLFNTRRHCRLCGEIFCKKCREFRIPPNKEHKFCEPCYLVRKSGGPEANQPLLTKPEVRVRHLNFSRYEIGITDEELFANAGAGSAASKAGSKDDSNGKKVLVLTHRRSTRPQLKVGFDTEEQRCQWRSLLQTATWASPSPITQDKLLRPAFLTAFKKLRWRAWVWTSWYLDGTEAELLAEVLSGVLYSEISGELSGKPEFARNMARKMIDRVTIAAVTPAWSSLMKALPGVREPAEKAAKSLLGPVFEQEKQIQAKVQQPMEEAAQSALDKVGPKMNELFAEHMPVMAAIAEAQMNVIQSQLVSMLAEVNPASTAKDFLNKLDWLMWRSSWSWSNSQRGISVMIDVKLCKQDVTRSMGYDLINDLTYLNQSAMLALQAKCVEQQGGGAAELTELMRAAWPGLIEAVGRDIVALLNWRLALALDKKIMPPLEEGTGKIVDTICGPLCAAIPNVLQDVVDPARTCGEIIQRVATNSELAITATLLKDVADKTAAQAQQLAHAGLV